MPSPGFLLHEAGTQRTPEPDERYRAPALDKGLDILEVLAAADVPLSQVEIAAAIERSPNEMFRMLERLVRRGYVLRTPSERYELGLKLHTLADPHAVKRRLAALAAPVMARLARQTARSCYLAVHERGRVIVLAQSDPPGDVGPVLHVRLHLPLLGEAAGHVLLAFQPPDVCDAMLAEAGVAAPAALGARLAAVRARGYELLAGAVASIAAPVMQGDRPALAALTALHPGGSGDPVELTRQLLSAAAAIGRAATVPGR
jgi:DNA-binding IclR family transcriptional regulator